MANIFSCLRDVGLHEVTSSYFLLSWGDSGAGSGRSNGVGGDEKNGEGGGRGRGYRGTWGPVERYDFVSARKHTPACECFQCELGFRSLSMGGGFLVDRSEIVVGVVRGFAPLEKVGTIETSEERI